MARGPSGGTPYGLRSSDDGAFTRQAGGNDEPRPLARRASLRRRARGAYNVGRCGLKIGAGPCGDAPQRYRHVLGRRRARRAGKAAHAGREVRGERQGDAAQRSAASRAASRARVPDRRCGHNDRARRACDRALVREILFSRGVARAGHRRRNDASVKWDATAGAAEEDLVA